MTTLQPFTAHEITILLLKHYLSKTDLEKVSQKTKKFSKFFYLNFQNFQFVFSILKKIVSISLTVFFNTSVIRQKGESENRCFKKTKPAKFSGKQTFLTPRYNRFEICPFALLPTNKWF